jgi:glycosyltransferase involved in cell wall biosynthesis
VKRLLLVSHRAIDQAGGPAARWRSFARHLAAVGWTVDVVAAPERASAVEFARNERGRHRAERRARVMRTAGRIGDPAFAMIGVRPEALPLSMAWLPRGAAAVRGRLPEHDVVLATGPPMVALLAARLALRAGGPPLVVELRDLWAGNPAFDRGGPLLPAVERMVFERAAAIVGCTPEAVADLKSRYPALERRVHEVPNGFEGALLDRRRNDQPSGAPLTILHSGTLTADRPLTPLLEALERLPGAFRLVLHGYVAPPIVEQVAAARGVDIQFVPPTNWDDAVTRIADADVTLVTQGHDAGDATAVASKVYEYLALGRPVLCVSNGGATEALLRRLGADALCARLDDEGSIAAALDRILAGEAPPPVPVEHLRPYERRHAAHRLTGLLSALTVNGHAPPAGEAD